MTNTNTKTTTLASTAALDAATRKIVSDIGAATRKADDIATTYNDGCLALLNWLKSNNYSPDHLVGGKSALHSEVKEAFAQGYFLKADLVIWAKGPHAKGTPGEKLDKRLGEKVKRMVVRMQDFVAAAKADPNGEVVYKADGKPVAKSDAAKAGARGQNKPLSERLAADIQTAIKRIRTDKEKDAPTLKGHDELIAAFKATLARVNDLNK